jgi:hypothetical protein
MKRIIMLFLLISSFILFIGCNNENKIFDKLYEKEKENIIKSTNKMLSKLGLENFEIIVYTHKNINNRIVSKSIHDTNWEGLGYNPEGPSLVDGIESPEYKVMSNLYGRMRQRSMVANYEPESKNEINYENFSILIIFENITQRKKDELLHIFEKYILNIERGDTIYIISKEDFNNLK